MQTFSLICPSRTRFQAIRVTARKVIARLRDSALASERFSKVCENRAHITCTSSIYNSRGGAQTKFRIRYATLETSHLLETYSTTLCVESTIDYAIPVTEVIAIYCLFILSMAFQSLVGRSIEPLPSSQVTPHPDFQVPDTKAFILIPLKQATIKYTTVSPSVAFTRIKINSITIFTEFNQLRLAILGPMPLKLNLTPHFNYQKQYVHH